MDLYLYGRAALALGYPNAPAEFHATMDIDAILPLRDLAAIENNLDFWNAQEQVNLLLGESGLYFTHLFDERQVLLSPDWLEKCVRILVPDLRHLHLWRPSTPDLILTKMMRIDPQDREDILFLLRQPDIRLDQVFAALDGPVIPPVQEIKDAFRDNRQWLLPKVVR